MLARSKLTNHYTLQGHVPAQSQQPGHRLPEQARKAAGHCATSVRLRAVVGGALSGSRNYPWKFEWTSVLGGRMFLDVLAGNWYNFFPLDPTRQYGLTSERRCRAASTRTEQPARRRCQRRVPGSEALQAAVLRRRCRTSRTAGTAATTSRSATTGSATAGPLRRRSRSTSLLRRDGRPRAVERDRDLQLAEHRHQRCRLQRRLHQRHLEVQRSPDVQPRRALRALRRRYPTGVTPERPSAAGQLASDVNPAERARYLDSIAPRTVEAQDVANTFRRLAARRVRVRPDRRQPDRAQGVLRPVLLQLGGHDRRPRESGRRRALRYQFDSMRQRQPSARRPAGARRCCAIDRRAAPVSSRRSQPRRPYAQ